MRHEMDSAWSALEKIEGWIEAWDRAADAAMLEPGCPQIPEQREKPRDLMAGSDGA